MIDPQMFAQPSEENDKFLPVKSLVEVNEKEQESDAPEEENENDEELQIKGEIDGDGEAESFEGFNGSGRTVTLQMLLAANVLQPGRAAMTIEYLGQKFVGDLLPDGKIKSHETETIFLSPSAWAMHCKRIINPEKKSGCGWASVKYKGKKLDAYKATWMRKCAQQNNHPTEGDEADCEVEKKAVTPPPPIKRTVLAHNTITNRNVIHDANTLIESVPFSTINKLQPFLVTFSSGALLLADFHSHLTLHEVSGYLGGAWDVNSHTLQITKCYPCRNSRHDREKAAEIEKEVQKALMKDQLILVGWYHSHAKFQSQPTLRDIDAQLDYQIKMRGPSDVTYTPCIGFIFSPYYEENFKYESNMTPFWVVSPPENRQMFEYGRPFYMDYSIIPDKEVVEDVRKEMQLCVDYYRQFRGELIDFKATYKEITFIEKLKISLYPKFPSKQDDKEFWNFVCKLLDCEQEEEFLAPKCVSKIIPKEEIKEDIKDETKEEILNTPDIKVMSLQEQLALPSGLNMNPTRLTSPLVTPAIAAISNSTPVTATSSPRDSPITIPSNSASPAKFELPVRASPSPAKSDTSSSRTRASPAPSPGKFSISDISRNSPSVTPNKYDHGTASSTTDIMAATMASLSNQIPPNFLPSDLNAFFQQQQQQHKDYGNSSLNQLAAAAAKVGNKPSTGQSEHIMYEKSGESIYSGNFSMPSTLKPDSVSHAMSKPPKQEPKTMKQSSGSSYKTKLMKELDDLKNDPLKISELMRSPEYAALLLQQAEALGATTLGTLGFGADFSFLGGPPTSKKSHQQQTQQAIDYTNLLQASKLLGYDAYMQQTKPAADLNAFLQQQLGQSVKKQQQQQQAPDYTALLQTYSKLFDGTNPYATSSKNAIPPELTALLNSTSIPSSNVNTGRKQKDTQNEMLNQLLQSEKNADMNSILYHQSKAAADLNALFVPPAPSMGSGSKGVIDPSAYYTQIAQEKMQDYAALFQQHHGKYGIPDPLSKSTLAANNMFMSPSALLKLQQESLNAIMMKPPKSSASSSTSSRARESSASPAQERLTPTKSGRGESPASTSSMKYNFSAVDLAISSVPPSSTPSPSSSESSVRRPSDTPPVDLSRIYGEQPQTKKRMEFSSIADLAAPPPAKQTKTNDREEHVLNLSSID